MDYSQLTDDEFFRPAEPKDLPPFPPEESEFIEIHNAPTPNGGDLSIAYFYDIERRPCKRKDAAFMNIVEYLNDGTRINEYYGKL